MASQVLESVAADLKTINAQISEANELISAMRDAGEDTAQLTADLRALEIRKQKWERMLQARGIGV